MLLSNRKHDSADAASSHVVRWFSTKGTATVRLQEPFQVHIKLCIKWCLKKSLFFHTERIIALDAETLASGSLGRRGMYGGGTLVGLRIIHVINKMVCENYYKFYYGDFSFKQNA